MKLSTLLAFVSYVAALPAGGDVPLDRRACTLNPTNPSTFWYESVTHNGISPFIQDGSSWTVYRNVKTDYGAAGDGSTDDSGAIQNAINAGNNNGGRTSNSFGTTGQPAVVYLPPGTYLLASPIQLYVDTVLMSDPANPATLLAAGGFGGNTVVYAKDPNFDSTINFFIGIKNIVIDSTNVDPGANLYLLDWSISQACQLSNVRFQMPNGSSGHTGLHMPEGGSALIINDCSFNGGNVGIEAGTQQYHFKGLTFNGQNTGIVVDNVFDFVVQDASFTSCGVGIDMSNNNVGTLAVIDSTAQSVGTVVSTGASSNGQGSLIIENLKVGNNVGSTVTAGGNNVLQGSVTGNAWVWGNAFTPGGPNTGAHQEGTQYRTSRAGVLVNGGGNFYAVNQPTYRQYDVSQVLNVKTVSGFPVAGDGNTDDTASLQSIINTYAGCKILFFPQGTYIITRTLTFPPGSRVYGEVWSAFSARGNAFSNAGSPTPMIRVGNPGDVGVAQFNDVLFTVADVLPGAVLVEVNMAGANPGDVGFWNAHFRIGGAAGSGVETSCGGAPADCKAAFLLLHLTSSSSAYVENSWLWTADHDLDSGNGQTISTGRGMLVEATKGTWLYGMGIGEFLSDCLFAIRTSEARSSKTDFPIL